MRIVVDLKIFFCSEEIVGCKDYAQVGIEFCRKGNEKNKRKNEIGEMVKKTYLCLACCARVAPLSILAAVLVTGLALLQLRW